MKHFNFYYDETEHSRKINHRTVSASNYHLTRDTLVGFR